MDEDVELPSERLPNLAENPFDRRVVTDVELGHERARDRRRELTDVLLDSLTLIGEREACATVGKSLGDRPGDRALVGDPENECVLPLEHEERL